MAGKGTLLEQIPLDFSKMFMHAPLLCLPKGTSFKVSIEEKSLGTMANSVIHIINPGSFKLSIMIRPSTWSQGVAPGHPLRAQLGTGRINAQFANVCVNVHIEGIFEFPDDPNDEFMEQFKWAQQAGG